jgi:hypothetical protein
MKQQMTWADMIFGRHHKSKIWLVAKILIVGVLVTAIASWDRGSAAVSTGAKPAPPCDLGFNTAFYNTHATKVTELPPKVIARVDFTLQQWVNVFTNPALGLSKETVLAQLNVNPMYKQQILEGVLGSKLGPDWWKPTTNAAECSTLRGQLQTARNVAGLFPTGAHAARAGYVRTSNYLGGVGVHYQNTNMANQPFSPNRPAQILYDGAQADAPVVGLSYFVRSPGDTPPAGFAGKNDRWIRHRRWCLDSKNILIAADILSPQQCAAAGGQNVDNPGWWTLHVWLVPGCQSDWGVFSVSNPRLPYMRAGMRRPVGCGTNTALTARPKLDPAGIYKIY